MKYMKIITSIFLCFTLCNSVFSIGSSYLKIDIVEAVNLHCRLNNEFYCNPYAIVKFKYASDTRTTKRIECTKNPHWESEFTYEPEVCHDTVYIYLYQYLTTRDRAFLGNSITDDERFEKGEISPGYLGRIVLDLDKLPFGMIDDWFMVDSPVENTRIMFPSCIHLRLYWTSTTCSESSPSSQYQLDSLKNNPVLPEKFEPRNFLPMCKKDFAIVYKTKFSRLDREGQVKALNELDTIDDKKRRELQCTQDQNQDYGFLHKFSNLTSIEEALVFKIVKRTTGENLNYEEFTKEFKNGKQKYIKSYKEFFEKECYRKMDLTIERINGILKNDAEKFPSNTTNPYLTVNTSALDYPLMLNKKMMDNVYNDTLDQFYSIEEVKNLDKMDDDSYTRTLNKMVKVMKEINAEKKIDSTLFYMKNKVMLTNEGRVHPKEEKFFRIYSLYKWNGGKFEYDEIKREYMLRRKYFYCYEIIKLMPTNIKFQFIDDVCPDNYVCIDPNGIVIKSKGRDPRKVFKTDIEKNAINLLLSSKDNNIFDKTTNLRFKSISAKNSSLTTIKDKTHDEMELDKENNKDYNLINFDLLLNQEENQRLEKKINKQLEIYRTDKDDDRRMNKFDELFIQRRNRIKKKKLIIINKIFNSVPLIGEVLAIANLENFGNNIQTKFIERETNLIKKYLLLYDANIPFVEKSASVLVNLILCNTDKNKLRYILNEMLEGLCYGDDRSLKIFEEIIRTAIIDSLLLKPYYYFDELQAKVNLVKTLNKPFCFKSITKIRFIEKMLMLDIVKEKITYIIWNNDTNKKIALKIHETELSIPLTLPNNDRLFSYSPQGGFDNVRDINKNYIKELERIENLPIYSKSQPSFNFKSLSDGEGEVAEEDEIVNKIQSVRKELDNDLEINEDDPSISKKKFNKDVKTYGRDDDKLDEFKDFYKEMHFKEKNYENNFNSNNSTNTENSKDKMKLISNLNSTNKETKLKKKFTKKSPKFQSINLDENDRADELDKSEEFAKISMNQYNNPHIYNQHDSFSASILESKNQPSESEILSKVMKDPETKKIIEENKNKPVNKIIFPKEIHTTYEVNRRGTKEVTVNQNNPTKKLIIDKLMDESQFNDLINQDEQSNKVDDQTGLYNVLKNIQNRKCSCDFLCIEIGTIYGPFDNLKPKNVTIMTNHKENVQVIIKPVIVVNNTIHHIPTPVPAPTPAPIIPTKNMTELFDNEDCDVLKMSSLFPNTNIYQENVRFKQLVDSNKKFLQIKRKFYRKVEYSNDILATDIFKQGLNVIILERKKGFRKIYERTFNTNVDAIESDAMACVLRDAGYDKIIVITGIGKWMGSITPRLIKEIKQIGGPDLNRLVSVDSEDNSMVDHAFILIGRRGLCRYNGVFRLKNYDVSRDLKRYFPDFSSDPNDCYFESLTFENEKNKHSENQFFHLIDLRLTLNLMNDNRFSYIAPIVKHVNPPSGFLNGGTCIRIYGENFGQNTLEIKEVLVRGVVCRNVMVVNSNLITCTTGSSTIMGPGIGNVQVKLMNGLSSPVNTCSMFQYSKEKCENSENQIGNSVQMVHQIVNPVHMVHHIIQPLPTPMVISPVHAYPSLPMFSFKEKKQAPDTDDLLKSLNKKMFAQPDPNSESVRKIDNLVTDNYKNLISNVESNGFNIKKDGFRKKRFQKIFEQLK